MKRNLLEPADTFSMSPLLALLPKGGEIGRLSNLTSSWFARYEKVSGLLKELDAQTNPDMFNRLSREQEMLKQILEWLEVKPQES